MRRGGDTEGDRHQGETQQVALAVDHLDVGPVAVDGVVELGGHDVERVDHVGGQRLGRVGRADEHEVVAADVARELGLAGMAGQGLAYETGRGLDGLVTPEEAVLVVEGLEVVEVGVDDREPGHGVVHQLVELVADLEVAGHAGERRDLPHLPAAA